MIKFYFKEDGIILPFCNISSTYYDEEKEELFVYIVGKDGNYTLRDSAIPSFTSQYLAWLDSQSTKQLT